MGQGEVTLDPQESAHLLKVMRKDEGDQVWVVDGKGNLYKTFIADANKRKCVLSVGEISNEYLRRAATLHMAVAPTKNRQRMEWFLEKATEIGVETITPVICERSERSKVRTDRMEKVLVSAMKQSLRAYLPQLNEAVPLKQFLSELNGEASRFLGHMDPSMPTMQSKCEPGSDAVVLIGPEGDLTEEEATMASNAGFQPVTLGKHRLRTETAAIVACQVFAQQNA